MDKKKCPYCEADTNDFILANQTADYSGIEMAINRQGMFRVRTYTHITDTIMKPTDYNFDSQDVIELKYCPLCGKPFAK